MTEFNLFKFDVRIRERMLRRGQLSEADIRRHLDGLADSEAKSEALPQAQPALGADPDDDDLDDDEEEGSEEDS
jgi:hypothetical protein